MKIKKISQSAGVVADVVNSLDSNSAINALSAAAGKQLREDYGSIVDYDTPSTNELVWIKPSKNLYNPMITSSSNNVYGVSFTKGSDNNIYANGTATGSAGVSCSWLELEVGKTYTCSADLTKNTYIIQMSKNGYDINNIAYLNTNNLIYTYTHTESSEYTHIRLYVMVIPDTIYENHALNMQIEEGNEVTFYTAPNENKIAVKDKNGNYNDFIKNSIAVGPEIPMKNQDVWFQRNENLYDNDSVQIVNSWNVTATKESGNIFSVHGVTNASESVAFISLTPITLPKGIYTISAITEGQFQEVRLVKSAGNGTIKNATGALPLTFVVNTDTVTFNPQFYIWPTATSNSMSVKRIQIESGDKNTLMDFDTDSIIWTKNKNGVYEKFVNITEVEKRITNLEVNLNLGKSDILYQNDEGLVASSEGISFGVNRSVLNYMAILVQTSNGYEIIGNTLNAYNGTNQIYWFNEGWTATFYNKTMYKVVGLCRIK